MRKSFVIAVVLLATMALTSPAMADPAATETFTFTLTEVNPCSPTGDTHEVTITLVDRIHFDHPQTFVLHSDRSGTTSSGFVMVNGTHNNMINGNVLVGAGTDMWWNPTTGERYITSGALVFNENTGTVQVSRDSSRCLSA
jgi:type 1 fimbria pilin